MFTVDSPVGKTASQTGAGESANGRAGDGGLFFGHIRAPGHKSDKDQTRQKFIASHSIPPSLNIAVICIGGYDQCQDREGFLTAPDRAGTSLFLAQSKPTGYRMRCE